MARYLPKTSRSSIGVGRYGKKQRRPDLKYSEAGRTSTKKAAHGKKKDGAHYYLN